ncbi:MAG: hypothetical protein J5672_00985 [Verrucomicrobia bacterium]|nr:hypothetical protein [Verrucomicrobiota bacterium]
MLILCVLQKNEKDILEKEASPQKFFYTVFWREYAECSYPQEASAGTVNNL